jgi:hypothetical protein
LIRPQLAGFEVTGDKSVFPLLAIVFIYLGYRAGVKEKAAGQIPAASDSQKRNRFWLLVAAYGASCVIMPFLLPYTGVVLPFGELAIVSITTFFICVGITWFTLRLKK